MRSRRSRRLSAPLRSNRLKELTPELRVSGILRMRDCRYLHWGVRGSGSPTRLGVSWRGSMIRGPRRSRLAVWLSLKRLRETSESKPCIARRRRWAGRLPCGNKMKLTRVVLPAKMRRYASTTAVFMRKKLKDKVHSVVRPGTPANTHLRLHPTFYDRSDTNYQGHSPD